MKIKRNIFIILLTIFIMSISISFCYLIDSINRNEGKSFIAIAGNQTKIKEPLKEITNTANSFKIDITPILQNPELPTGCEVTSLATVLKFYGYKIDKIELSDKYLTKSKIGESSPYLSFIGDPKNKSSYGCYSPVIVNCANKYLYENNIDKLAYNVSNSDFSEFEKYIYNNIPVILWQTINMVDPYISTTWKSGNETVEWISNEHVTVLIGWNKDNYIFADPLKGIVEYNKSKTIQRYNELGKQAVIIY